MCALLCIACRAPPTRTAGPLPPFLGATASAAGKIKLVFPGKWLRNHPLTSLDLAQEADYLAVVPLRLTVEGR